MTLIETIRATLDRLWETDATAYDIAWAILKAADIESDDLEIKVESVISRALKAKELVDLAKVAVEVVRLLPGDHEGLTPEILPLCEAIKDEIKMSPFTELKEALAATWCMEIVDKHFAALSVEQLARALCGWRNGKPSATPYEKLSEIEKAAYRDQAQAVLRLLRKE